MKSRYPVLLLLLLTACTSGREDVIERITRMELELRSDTLPVPDESRSAAMMKAYDEFAVAYPADSLTPEYLFRAADLAQGIRHESVAIRYYERIRKEYPKSARAAAALFMEAFVLDYNLGEKEQAKQKYAEFLKAYPGHALAPSASASLEQLNLGLSDEELVRMFEEKQDSIKSANR